MAKKQILIICGEPSGDLHAGNLARQILNLNPAVKISAVGGPHLASSGAQVFYDIKELSVMGFFDVLKKLPKFLSLKKTVLKKIAEENPDLIVMVDFSGFNLRLAKCINRKIPIIYYVSPQVWASRTGRIKTIKEYVKKIIVFFKFEEGLYRKYGIDVSWVGHPLLDTAAATMERNEFLNKSGLSVSKRIIALLPGSRKQEIRKILPIMLSASRIINEKAGNLQFVIAKAQQLDRAIYEKIASGFALDLKIISGETYNCLKSADFALVCSGTATLETAIIGTPFAVIYKMGLLNYLLYRPQVKLPYIGMVNIVAGKKIAQEFIQFRARPKKIAEHAIEILTQPQKQEQLKAGLVQVKSQLGEKGATLRAARLIINYQETTSGLSKL